MSLVMTPLVSLSVPSQRAKNAPPVSRLVVHELYASVQGESTFTGRPCTFVRLTGCNLRCRWCDTEHAFTGGRPMDVADVVESVRHEGHPLVEVTGGEPLLQPATPTLLRRLCDEGFTVLLETSGERDISRVDPRVHRIVDLKAPGSGESHRMRWENLDHLTSRDEIKIVMADRKDYEWARTVLRERQLAERAGEVLFGCVHGELHPRTLVRWIVEDQLPVRFQLQLHKVVWGADARGV